LSYDPSILFYNISVSLRQNPATSLENLAQELKVSRRTIQKTVVVNTGKNFRQLRETLLVTRAKVLFVSEPHLSIKALSSKLGYESPRSFARAIRRACGVSPEQLRSFAGLQLLSVKENIVSQEQLAADS